MFGSFCEFGVPLIYNTERKLNITCYCEYILVKMTNITCNYDILSCNNGKH